jgi:hypothetical protein
VIVDDDFRSIHEWIKSSAALVQAVALVAGVWFGISQLKSRQEELGNRALSNTIQINEGLNKPDVQKAIEFIEENSRSNNTRVDVSNFGANTLSWRLLARNGLPYLMNGQCDEKLMRFTFCTHEFKFVPARR